MRQPREGGGAPGEEQGQVGLDTPWSRTSLPLASDNRGRDLSPEIRLGRLVLGYAEIDGGQRCTLLRFHPIPPRLGPGKDWIDFSLAAGEEAAAEFAVACWRGDARSKLPGFETVRTAAGATLATSKVGACPVSSSNSGSTPGCDGPSPTCTFPV
jgi:hypothetical protein